MADDEGKTGGEGDEGDKGTDAFDPKSLSPEAQEHIRKEIQSRSDSGIALVEKKLRDDQATRARSAVETAEQRELQQLADSGQDEALGQRVRQRLTQRSAEEKAIASASDLIERQMADKFSETLGPERVEEIRRKVVTEGGAHAEFAKGLAEAEGGESRKEEIADEVKAQLMEARGEKRDAAAGADRVSGSGQGTKLSNFEEIEQAYTEGKVKREAYEAAKKARDEGQ